MAGGDDAAEPPRNDVVVRPLVERDIPVAERIFRLAFGTFVGAVDPATHWSDRDYLRGRWRADPSAAFAAELDGEVVGSNFATNWGSVGFFGPLTVHPDLWDRRIGQLLIDRAMRRFDAWGTQHVGLMTFAHSAKHRHVYEKFGFRPRGQIALMERDVRSTSHPPPWSRYADLSEAERDAFLGACRSLTHALHPGLNVEAEIRSVLAQQLGDTVLLPDTEGLAAFAVCHYGPGSEAGSGRCYLKFGAARPGPAAGRDFGRLLQASDALAGAQRLQTLVVGVNLARFEAHRRLIRDGFRAASAGVAMDRPNEAAYNRSGVYIIDDWR
jgi:predicted N-acetyltransferase YhbS